VKEDDLQYRIGTSGNTGYELLKIQDKNFSKYRV